MVTGTDFADGKVQWDSCHYVTRDRYDQDRNIQIQNDDILITKDGSLGKTALVQGLSKPATLNSGIFVIRPLQNAYDPVFVYHILSSFVFKDFLDKLSAGSTIIHLYQKDVGKFEFLLPPTIEEQKAKKGVIKYAELLDAYVALAKNATKPEDNTHYPESIRGHGGLRALYDNCGEDEAYPQDYPGLQRCRTPER